MASAKRRKSPNRHSDEEYLGIDIGSHDDFPAAVKCRKTALIVTRKEHPCFGTGPSNSQHIIPMGSRVYRETGKCEGKFGSVYLCLPCADFWLEPERR